MEHLRISHFRGIQQGELRGFQKLNLLMGPNNSGKSAVLEALYLLGSTDWNSRADEGGAGPWVSATIRRDCYDQVPLSRIQTRHHLREHCDGRPSLRTEAGSLPGVPLVAFHPRGDKKLSTVYAGTDQELPLDTGMNILLRDQSLTFFRSELGIVSGSGPLSDATTTAFHDAQLAQERVPMSFVKRLTTEVRGSMHALSQSCTRLLESPQPLNVAFLPFEQNPSYAQMLLSTEDQLALSIDEYGDGTRSAMKMLLMLIAVANRATPERPGLFLWEEPELFQNPRMLKKMLEELVRIIQHRPVQVFIATHSLEVMGLLLKLTEEGTLPPNDLKAYRLQLKSGVLTSSWYSRDNLLTWLQEGLDPRIWGDFYVPLRFYWPSQTEETR